MPARLAATLFDERAPFRFQEWGLLSFGEAAGGHRLAYGVLQNIPARPRFWQQFYVLAFYQE